MRTTILVIFLIVLASIVTGCKSAPGQPAAGETSPAPAAAQSFDLGELSYIFETPADPVDVAVVLETDNTIEALIPVEGGSISATGADGTVYTLEIPTDALLNETTISLTPVTSVADMPFGGEQTYAVQLGPEGLSLFNFAILTITPVEEIPLEEQIVFGYLKKGSDLILAAPVVDSSEIKINVLHFSGFGVTKGINADIEVVRERLGGDAERRLSNALAEKLGRERSRQLLGGEEVDASDLYETFDEAWKQFEEQVIKPRLAAAGESCAAGKLALQTVLSHERQRQLLGASDGKGLDQYADLYNKVARVCMIEEFEYCVEDHIIWHILVVYQGMLQQNAILPLYTQATLNEARDLTIKCLTFRLEFESTGKIDLEDGGYESSVTSELILRYDPEAGFIVGAVAELVNTDFEFFFPCGATSITGGGDFAVLGLSYEIDGGEPDEDGSYPDVHVSDLKLVYMPGNTSESAKIIICGSTGAPLPMTLPAWTATFLATHIQEMGEGGFIAIDWEILEDELFAEKEWSLVSAEDASISEEGNFKLYHVPGG